MGENEFNWSVFLIASLGMMSHGKLGRLDNSILFFTGQKHSVESHKFHEHIQSNCIQGAAIFAF